jgi:hypothetical protein
MLVPVFAVEYFDAPFGERANPQPGRVDEEK